mmetsp:Transcript_5422/g.18328  ORF Transcript_5422/g.18328 Transcript_5422/m.18328 type:complete len:228 (-) Transcript_5422:965-1648(-)
MRSWFWHPPRDLQMSSRSGGGRIGTRSGRCQAVSRRLPTSLAKARAPSMRRTSRASASGACSSRTCLTAPAAIRSQSCSSSWTRMQRDAKSCALSAVSTPCSSPTLKPWAPTGVVTTGRPCISAAMFFVLTPVPTEMGEMKTRRSSRAVSRSSTHPSWWKFTSFFSPKPNFPFPRQFLAQPPRGGGPMVYTSRVGCSLRRSGNTSSQNQSMEAGLVGLPPHPMNTSP